MKTKICQNCIWFDQCGQEYICDYFDPIYNDDNEIAYKSDLEMRAEEYQLFIDEMNSIA